LLLYVQWHILGGGMKLDRIESLLKQGQKIPPRAFMRHLRHNRTEAEQLLWRYLANAALRKGQRGMRFKQQVSIGPYFADFLCKKKRLVVEVDGGYHDSQKEYDQSRDDFMTTHGYLVLRFKNDEVMADIQSVLSNIYLECARSGARLAQAYKRG